jgi:hypothetical protein
MREDRNRRNVNIKPKCLLREQQKRRQIVFHLKHECRTVNHSAENHFLTSCPTPILVYQYLTMATTTTDMSASAYIRSMNANAVNYMQHGMNQRAVGQLKQAMGCLTTYLAHEERNGMRDAFLRMKQMGNFSSYPHQEPPVSISTTTFSPPLSTVPLHFPSTCISRKTNQIDGSSTSISTSTSHQQAQARNSDTYDRAFLFPPHYGGSEEVMLYEYRTQAIAVLLYNTALAYHRSGIQSGKSAELWHAASTYNLIPSMLGQDGLQKYPELVVLVLGLISNVANIYYELRQGPALQSALAILRDLMIRVPYECMPREDYAFFQLHLLCLQEDNFSYAPAA